MVLLGLENCYATLQAKRMPCNHRVVPLLSGSYLGAANLESLVLTISSAIDLQVDNSVFCLHLGSEPTGAGAIWRPKCPTFECRLSCWRLHRFALTAKVSFSPKANLHDQALQLPRCATNLSLADRQEFVGWVVCGHSLCPQIPVILFGSLGTFFRKTGLHEVFFHHVRFHGW